MGSIRLNGRSYGGSPTVTDANHLTCEDGSGNIITAQSAIQNILGDFATIEASAIASKAYAVGDYLVNNGNFYKAIDDIVQGDTITPNTNVIKTTVGDELDELSDEFSSTFKIKYKNTNWSTIHSFPVETVNRIGLILTHDGTLYSFAQYASTGNFNITKLAGTHTITVSVQDGYNRLSIDASVGLIVVTI